RRFGWRGTWDPAAALGVERALAEFAAWRAAGDLERATAVADHIARALQELGLTATAGEELVPPRLRGFLLPGVALTDLQASLQASAVRAWTGRSAEGVAIVRISTHVYNDMSDAVPLLSALRSAWSRSA
ncbi:MAG: hypothetical protein HGA51_11070, partial [Demequinaceae bacterium]|nr:hypothetical protein [Demequinaceae bacterium]